jgi:hypothetical protein
MGLDIIDESMDKEKSKSINSVFLRNGSTHEIEQVDSINSRIQSIFQENPEIISTLVEKLRVVDDSSRSVVSMLPHDVLTTLWNYKLISHDGLLEESLRDVLVSAVVTDLEKKIRLIRPYDLPPFIEKRIP